MSKTAFKPAAGSTTLVNANTGGSPVAVSVASGTGEYQVRVRNKGTADAYVEFGGAAVTAAAPAAGTPGSLGVAAGAVAILTVKGTYVAVQSSSTPSIEITVGEGL